MKKIKSIVAISALIYLILCCVLFFFQRDLLYYPSSIYKHNYSSASFENDNETIDVVTINTDKSNAILYFSGNAGAAAKNASIHASTFPNHAIYLVNYRGYGKSTGSPSEAGIYSDALHIFDKIKEKHATISVIGRSLGTGVATYVAVNRDVEKIILITPYDSIESIAAARYPLFPVSLLLQDKYRSIDRVPNISSETLVLLAENDSTVPLKNSLHLISKFKKSLITVKTLKGTKHNHILNTTVYQSSVSQFMRKR